MKLLDMLSVIPFYQMNKDLTSPIHVQDIKMDHRELEQGDLFFCIRGFTVDGHQFAQQAVENGAVAIIADHELPDVDAYVITVPDTHKAMALMAAKFYGYPTVDMPLIGITGTNGKTTITYLLDEIFKQNNLKTGLIGTIQTKIGEEILAVKNTTPDALLLQNVFRKMKDQAIDIAMMEVSSHALDLGRVHGCDFDIAVFTNLSQDHLDYHKDMEDYLRAKTLLFTGLGNSYGKQFKYAVLNQDDVHSEIIAKSTSQPIVTYGIEEQADITATNIQYDTKGMRFTLETPMESISINTKLIGKFNIYNMLASAATAILKGVPLSIIKTAFEAINGVAGRFEQVNAGQNFAVVVDYAHTPDSLENVLQTVKEFTDNKVYVVVGTGGDRDKKKRPLMANVALDYADQAIFTSDNPRTEDPQSILSDMTNGLNASHYEVIENRKEAISHAVNLANEGDVLLIAGKGHETYQEINGVRHDFDDRLIAKEAIRQRSSQ